MATSSEVTRVDFAAGLGLTGLVQSVPMLWGAALVYVVGIPLFAPTVPILLMQCVPASKRGQVSNPIRFQRICLATSAAWMQATHAKCPGSCALQQHCRFLIGIPMRMRQNQSLRHFGIDSMCFLLLDYAEVHWCRPLHLLL